MRTVTRFLSLPLILLPGLLLSATARADDPALIARLQALTEAALVDPGPATRAMAELQRSVDPANAPVALRRLAELRCKHEPVTAQGVAVAREALAQLGAPAPDASEALRQQHLRLMVCERQRSAYAGSPELSQGLLDGITVVPVTSRRPSRCRRN